MVLSQNEKTQGLEEYAVTADENTPGENDS